jgi:hypothetical protein
MTDFRFIDALPPAPSDRRGDRLIADFADALRANPGRWAEYPYPSKTDSAARTTAARIRHNRGPKPLRRRVVPPAGRFNACTRKGIVYVRFERPIL